MAGNAVEAKEDGQKAFIDKRNENLMLSERERESELYEQFINGEGSMGKNITNNVCVRVT